MRDLSLTSFPCQKHIRKAALLFMDREDNQSRFNLPSAAAVIKYCKTEKKSDGPSLSADNSPSNPLRLDLNATASSPWNVRCFRIFAKAYVKLSDSLCDDVDTVQAIFRGQFKSLKVAYRKIMCDQLPDNEKQKQAKESKKSRENGRIHEVSIFTYQSSSP